MVQFDPSKETQGLPPKLNLKKSGLVGGETGKIDLPDGQAPKRETSRIPLDPAGDDTVPTVTIAGMGKAAVTDAAGADTSAEAGDAKRQTSRISLETALASDDGAEIRPADGGPKTIRLKRPSEAATVKVSKAPGTQAESFATQAKSVMSKTAILDDTAPPDAGPTPTRKKTIRVKRPTKAAGLSDVPVKRTGLASEEEALSLGVPVAADEPGALFSLCAVAAVIIVGITLYVLCAQACPNLGLSWPGQV